jgi:hypothetical protein
MSESKRGVAAVAALGVLVPLSSATGSASAAAVAGTVLIYGDSVMAQAAPTATAAFATHVDWFVVFSTHPGEALCDWLPAVSGDLATCHPTLVVLETMGKTGTACTTARPLHDRSREVLRDGHRDWHTGRVPQATSGQQRGRAIHLRVRKRRRGPDRAQQRRTAQGMLYHGVSVSRGPRFSVATSTGAFTATKACLKSEAVAEVCKATTHEVSVRSEDGLHLCDITAYPDVTCQTYSSGALRYGEAVVAVAITPPTASTGSCPIATRLMVR